MITYSPSILRNLSAVTLALGLHSCLTETTLAQSGYANSPQAVTGEEIPGQEVAINWLSNPDQAMAYARQSGRPILAYVTSANCGYCRKMERESWSHPAIANKIANGFVPLRLDAKQHAVQVRALKVRAYPTTLVLSPEGQIATGSAGFLSPIKLAKLLAAGPEVAALPSANSSVGTR